MSSSASAVLNCHICGFKSTTITQNLQHQRIHQEDFNFQFKCPIPTCHFIFDSFVRLNSHVSNHGVSRQAHASADDETSGITCVVCDKLLPCYQAVCYHFLDDHLKNGEPVLCPRVDICGSGRVFSKREHLASHLSQFHPGWRQDFNAPVQSVIAQDAGPSLLIPDLSDAAAETCGMEDCDTREPFPGVDGYSSVDDSTDSLSDVDSEYGGGYTSSDVITSIAKFYAMLEGKLIVPAQTVQVISEKIAILSEILLERLTERLTKHLKSHKLSEETINDVTSKVLADDPLYNSHHTNSPGVSLTTDYLRKEFYHKNFKYVAPEERNLRKNPNDRSAVIQYVPIAQTLKVLLDDPTVQASVDESFSDSNNDPNIIRNYTDGKVFQKRQVPRKRIDVIIFQDAFTSAKIQQTSYKVLGVYMTLGNLKPHQRSKLRAKRLVFLTLEKNMNAVRNGLEKAFRKPVSDLQALEASGIEYKGEIVPVRLQFLVGDNLGQHTVGGYYESFSLVYYFCRYCKITRDVFKEDQEAERPIFRTWKWRTPRHYESALQKIKDRNLQGYKGIKRDSVFNKLQFFHVADPGQPGCLAHDFLIGGIVDCDLAAMIKYFVGENWFSYALLNRRIREFKCVANDAPNKPAPVHLKGKKLGGYAVQNWTLLRLLPFLIGDKVTVDDEVWQLYLLLKKYCELAFAPALSRAQIDLLKSMGDEYMMKRKCLANKYKPKHHYGHHTAAAWLQFGPPVHLWTLGFEQCHQFYIKVARNCRNFKNVTKLLVSKQQLLQAYQSTGPLFPDGAVHHSSSFTLVAESFTGDLQAFITACNFSRDTSILKSITLQDIHYQKHQWLILSSVKGEVSIRVGKILLVLFENQVYKLILEEHTAKFWGNYGVYKIKARSELSLVPLNGTLENPCPHAVYEWKNKLCISLKHVLPI